MKLLQGVAVICSASALLLAGDFRATFCMHRRPAGDFGGGAAC